MSYCRFSTDDFQCDVYCYESFMGGFAIHVAGNRVIPCEPLPPPIALTKDGIPEYLERSEIVREILDRSPRTAIGLQHDGEEFMEPDAGAAAERLKYLRDLGYNVPQFAIDALIEESKEAA
jgi:hypothetical protein